MKARVLKSICILILSLALTGCLLRTYTVRKERLDQNVSGNRGYIQGKAPKTEAKEKSSTRETVVVEVELSSPIKFGAPPRQKTEQSAPRPQDQSLSGNLGYLTGSSEKSMEKATMQESRQEGEKPISTQYKVEKGDTLQKISKKFYGSYSKWQKIYNVNKDKIKNPDDIYPGLILNIPRE